MRILIHSNAPWAATGYGVQTKLIAPRLAAAGHDVAISAFYGLEGNVMSWGGMTVYPRAFHPYGMDVVAQHADDHKADIILTLVDAWVVDPVRITASGARWVPLFPVDHDPMPAPVLKAVKQAFQSITYSRHGFESARAEGLDPLYCPHGVDTTAFSPVPQAEAREKLGIPEDAFLVGIVAANKGTPSRKALPTQLEAFARLHERHPEALLYLHTHLTPEMDGLDLETTIRALGIPEEAVKVCNQYRNILGYSDPVMAAVYSCMDVLSSATMGEGFGVPIIEAQACGVPVIVGDWTSMPELVGAGWKVTECERVLTPMGAYQYLPTVDGVLEAMEHAYAARGDERLRTQAREFATGYDADAVTDQYWVPALARIAEMMSPGKRQHVAPEVIAA